jgi:large subunit ribosomal protein L29
VWKVNLEAHYWGIPCGHTKLILHMKKEDIKSLSVGELQDKLTQEQEALVKLQFAHAISPVENPMKIRASRRAIARIQTELRAKQLAKAK